jgi:hypothetical protein
VGKRVPLPVGAQKGDSLINFKNKKIGCYTANILALFFNLL